MLDSMVANTISSISLVAVVRSIFCFLAITCVGGFVGMWVASIMKGIRSGK